MGSTIMSCWCAAMSNDANHRLKRAVDNLKTQTELNNQFSGPRALNQRMRDLHTPALGLAIIDNYEVAAVGAYGFGEAGVSQSVTQNSLFQAGSISKPVFASAVLYLVQQGQIDLDEDINHYLSSWQIPSISDWQPRITLRQILSHTAGLTVHGFPGYQTNEDIPTVPQILNGEQPANTSKVFANVLPGVQFRYSGGGTTVAQLAMTDFLNETFPALMKRLVFDPLGMHNSTFENPLPSDLLSKVTVAHPFKAIPLKGGHHVYPEMAAAGLWTTPADLAIFGLALMKGLRGDDTGFLNQASLETMLRPQLAKDNDASDYVSLGFFCDGCDNAAVFRHGGWDEGFVAEMTLFRHQGKGAVVMINSNEGHPLIGEVVNAIAEEFDWSRNSKQLQVVQLPDLSIYSGQFKASHSQQITISVTGDGLYLKYDTQPPVLFEAATATRFFSQVLNTELVFTLSDDGAVAAVTIQQDGMSVEATKLSG